jgi:hypothetical protein
MFMALGVMQYSVEQRHPRFVIILESIVIAAMLLVTIHIAQNKSVELPAIMNPVDRAYSLGYEKGLLDCNNKKQNVN